MRPRYRAWVAAALLAAACGGAGEEDFIERMAREHADDSGTGGAAERMAAASVGEEVAYAELEGDVIRGYLARPAAGSGAAVIVIHEWWGLNDNIRMMARKLADEGYLALAVDLYEGGVADDRDGAMALARASRERRPRLEENLRQAIAFLRQQQGASRLGVIGWCFGGGWSLATALLAPESIDAAVIYYGRLVADRDELARLESPVLGIFGALDGGIPVASVREFESTLGELGKPASIHVYEGADHAFANPTGSRYQAAAAEDAWQKTMAFFSEHLR